MTATDLVGRVIDALETLRISYMIVGSFSSNVYGKPRSTKDADFVVEMGDIPVSALAARLGPDFDLDRQMSFETITATTRHRFRHRASAFVIEIFLISDDPFDRRRFDRRLPADVGGRQAFVPAVEDVVIQKLRWSKQGRRQKDVDDALGVLQVQGADRLDLEYIRSWCDWHNTRSLFESLLIESRRFEQEIR